MSRTIYLRIRKFQSMNKKILLVLPVILGIIVLISVPSVTAQSESNEIPSWIKGVANFWIDGGINDAEFIEALEFMIDNNVIKLGENISSDSTVSQLQKENNVLKEKLDTSEANRVSQSQSAAAQHEKLYAEVEEKYEKKENLFFEEHNKELDMRNEKIDNLLAENESLKKKLSQAGIEY